jgi:hypothetical protein
MIKRKPKVKGEIISIVVLILILVWFFLINFDPLNISLTAIVSGLMLVLAVIWSVISILRFIRV